MSKILQRKVVTSKSVRMMFSSAFRAIRNMDIKSVTLSLFLLSFLAGSAYAQPQVAPPDPICDQADVISLFSNSYTDVPVTTFLTPWSAAPVTLTDVQIVGNDAKLYEDVTFLGIETTGADIIDASGMTYFNIDIFSDNATQFRIKLVDFGADMMFGGGDDSEHELTFDTPAIGEWVTYSVPLADFINLTSTEHIAQYILSAMPNMEADFFMDNMYFSSSACVTAAPDPTCDAMDVISLFSNTYTDVPVSTFLTPWSAAPVTLTDLQIAGNDTKLYEDVTFLGIETTGADLVDASGMTYFNIDIWSSNATQFRIKLVDFGADMMFGGGDDTEHELTFDNPAQNEWVSYNLPLSSFTNLTNTDNIAQYILSAMPNTEADFYMDNMYFSNCADPVDVEFCVDLSCLDQNPQVPSVYGTFTTPPFNAGQYFLADQGQGIWCATVPVLPGDHEYLFFDQIQGPEEFAMAESCTTTASAFNATPFNRTITVEASTPQMVTFGWESCNNTCTPPPPGPDLTITFDDPMIDYNLADFAGAQSEIQPSPTDQSDMVVCTRKTQDAATFAGTIAGANGLDNPIPFTAENQVMFVDVWSPEAGVPVLLKVEDASNAGIFAEVLATTTVAMEWETLIFDFSLSTNQPLNLANTYDKVVIFFDFGNVGADQLFYWDDVQMGNNDAYECALNLSNGGFETGDYTDWDVMDINIPFVPATVQCSDFTVGFGFDVIGPLEGSCYALNGFDGGVPGTITTCQTTTLPINAVSFNWSDNIAYDLISFGATLDRMLEVTVDGTSLYSFSAMAGTFEPGTGWVAQSVDISQYAGQTVEICFVETIPESFTGPAQIAIDETFIVKGIFDQIIPSDTTVTCLEDIPVAPVITASCSCDESGPVVFINEIHYDNASNDVGEFIEVAGSEGYDLSTCELVLYNGNGGGTAGSTMLSGTIDDEGDGFGAVQFLISGIQNGSPDGVALVCNGVVTEFISWEGSFVATNGPAMGMMSTDIGVSESGATPIGESLQLTGTGSAAADFTWVGPLAESPGELNTDQTIEAGSGEIEVVFSESRLLGECPSQDTIRRFWSAMDGCGNMVQDSQFIYLIDTLQPSFVAPMDTMIDCEVYAASMTASGMPTDVMDACGTSSVSFMDVMDLSGCNGTGTVTRTWTVGDDCGNDTMFFQMITVQDTTPPTFTVPADIGIACTDNPQDTSITGGVFDAMDNCTGVVMTSLWINELHYDNTGGDVNEFFEIAGTAGTDLMGYSMVLYNGANGQMYNTIDLTGVIADEGEGFGALAFIQPGNGIQNGAPDGLAFYDAGGGLIEFISYEGSFVAADGPAMGEMSVDIMVQETGGTQVGESLQKTGSGSMGMDFVWSDPSAESPGMLNVGQTLIAVPEPEEIMVTFTDTGILNPVSGTGTLTRTWVAEDACGNTSSQDQMITISDNLAPTFICLGKITRFLEGGACNIIVDYNIVATDNCDDNPTITQTDLSGFTSGDSFPEGIYTQTYQAEDVNGNISICSFEIEIIQVEPTDLSLTCEGSIINVSIDQDCQVIIQPDVLLVGDDHGCYGTRYQVNIDLNRDGVFDDGNVADISHVGQVFDAQVEDTETGNMCWSQLRFEDKIDPIVNCGCEGYEPIDENAMTLIGVFNGHTYYTSTGNFTWQDAQAQAESMSGHLVSINSPEENMFIQEFISTMSGRSWIGLTDNEAFGGTEADTDPVEGWVWTSGEPVTFTNWSTGEPNNLGNEDFAEMFENGQWNDLPNSGPGNTIPFILEIDGVCEFECDEDLVDVAAPEVIDCGIESMTYTDAEEDLACVTGFERIINRTWTIVDLGGNEASCTQRIFVRVTGLEDFDFPENMDGIVNPALECNGNWVSISNPDYPGLRIPSPQSTGEPGGSGCGFLQSTYWDHIIPICDLSTDNPAYWGTYKVVRHWITSNWCTGEVEEMNQLIKVEDTTAPTVTCPDDVTVGVTGHDCDRDLMRLPYPTVIDECGHATATPSVVTSEGGVILPGAFLYQQGADWFVRDLTIGDNVITWTANDGCGNEGECDYTITVEDQTPPVPVCESYRQVSVTSDGYAKIFAEAFDDGSNDNCGPVWFKVVREVIGACDQINGDDSVIPGYQEWPDDYVKFCCADIGEPVRVRLRVYDVDPGAGPIAPGAFAGRWNECWSEVTVEDKLPPAISCPPDMTVSCDNDILISDLDNNDAGNQYGTAVAFDNCDAVITVRANEPTDCGTGSRFFTRTFTATDPDGRIARCTQRIFLEESPFKICDTEARCTQLGNSCDSPHSRRDNVEWPCDLVLEECGLGLDPWQLNANAANVRDANGQRVALNAYPRYDNAGELNGQILGVYPYACAQIAIDSADQVFTLVEDACLKILRTWTVIDWCQFDAVTRDPDDPNRFLGYWEYIQVIKVRNTVGPTFAEVGNTDFCDESTPDCLVSVSLTSGATDDCTPEDHLHYAWAVDAFSDGSYDLAGNGPTFSGRVPQAFGNQNHTIRWTVEDGCGNTSVTEYTFTAKECKKPTPYCDNGIAIVVMPSSGSVAVWASDLDAGSFDNCTEQENLEFGIRKIVDGNPVGSIQPSLTLDCDCMPNGVSETISVEIWVTDEAGNTDNCVTYILLQDTPDENNPEGVCTGNDPVPVPLVGGGIATEEGISAQAHEVQLVGADNQVIETNFTGINGEYAFVTLGGEAVRPVNNLDPALGLSTLDLIAVQRHVLGIELFESPYKMIAADVTNDGAINVLDLLEEQQVILGLRSEFANNQSWVYVAADEVMDINNPYSYESPKSIPSYTQDDNIVQDFVAIKIGDVNATALNGAGTILERSGLVLEIADEKVVYGEETLESEIRVPVTSSNFTSIDGYQFTLDYDQSNLEFVSIESGALNIRPENVGVHTSGKVATNWYDETAQTVEAGEVLFTLVFRGESIESLVINSDVTSAESYRNGQIQSVRLAFNGATAEAFALRQNEPNPFSAQTKIMFDLPSATTATLTVFDVTGKTLMSRNIDGAAGYNETVITKSDVNATGVLYYRVDTEDYTATKKMISIQ